MNHHHAEESLGQVFDSNTDFAQHDFDDVKYNISNDTCSSNTAHVIQSAFQITDDFNAAVSPTSTKSKRARETEDAAMLNSSAASSSSSIGGLSTNSVLIPYDKSLIRVKKERKNISRRFCTVAPPKKDCSRSVSPLAVSEASSSSQISINSIGSISGDFPTSEMNGNGSNFELDLPAEVICFLNKFETLLKIFRN